MSTRGGIKLRFYGWVILLAASLSTFVGIGSSMSLSVFFPALLNHFHWSRSGLAGAFFVRGMVGAVIAPLVGWMVNRFGPRRMVLLGALLGTGGIMAISLTTQQWHFYLTFGVLSTLGLSAGTAIPVTSTLRRWFMRWAGIAGTLASSGGGLGIIVMVQVSRWLIDSYSWQTAYLVMGIVFGMTCLLVAALLRRDPESMGTYPDGIKPTPEEMRARRDFLGRMETWTFKEAARTSTLWLFMLAQISYMWVAISFQLHFVVFTEKDLGLSRAFGVSLISLMVLAAILSRVAAGFLSDWLMARFGLTRKPVLMVSHVGVIVSMFYALLVTDAPSLTLLALAAGFSYGIGLGLYPVYLGDLFGVVSLPLLMGWMHFITAFYPAIGTYFYGIIYDLLGSYDWAFLTTGLLGLVSLASLALLRHPVKAPQPARAS